MSHLKYVFLSLGLAWCEILSVQAGVMGAQILNAPDDARFEFAEPTPHGFPSALRTRVFYPDHEALGRAIDEIRVKPPKPASPRPPSQAPAAGSLPADPGRLTSMTFSVPEFRSMDRRSRDRGEPVASH